MRKYLKDYLILFSIAGLIVLLDQITKYIVRTNIPFGQIYRPDLWLSQFVRIVHWRNTGAAFGLFQDINMVNMVFTILAIIVAGVIIYYFPRIPREDWLIRLAMSLQLGGAVGNLIDRLAQAHVTDFISVWNFPVFNIADASISIGVALLFIALWQRERQEKKQLENLDQSSNESSPSSDLTTGTPITEETQGE